VLKNSANYLIGVPQVIDILHRTIAIRFQTRGTPMILHTLIAILAGWIERHQQQIIAYLQEENRILTHPERPV
jgi:hypothetical protein